MPSKILGQYANDIFGLEIIVGLWNDLSEEVKNRIDVRPKTKTANEDLFVSFDADFSHPMALSCYCGDVYSFFPPRNVYEAQAMYTLHDATQFLLHMHFDKTTRQVIGLWWQFERTSDGLWFHRSSPC